MASSATHSAGPWPAPVLRPVYQPVVDLADRSVVGYEALARWSDDGVGRGPAQRFAAARASDRLTELDSACLEAAIRDAREIALAAPFTLFLNAEPTTFHEHVPATGPSLRCLVELTDRALALSPADVLRALEQLRAAGWGVALDAVGADPRTLALVPLLQPDVIKLDLPRIRAGGARHVAAVAAAAGVERERSGATLLAKGIETEADLEAAESCGATLGQGFLLGRPEPLARPLPTPGRPVPFIAAGADPWVSDPWRRITRLQRPRRATIGAVEAVAVQLETQAVACGAACGVFVVPPAPPTAAAAAAERLLLLERQVGTLRTLPAGDDDGAPATWTVVVLSPFFAAVLVARQAPDGDGDGDHWSYALTYDRRTAVECALMLAARLPAEPDRGPPPAGP